MKKLFFCFVLTVGTIVNCFAADNVKITANVIISISDDAIELNVEPPVISCHTATDSYTSGGQTVTISVTACAATKLQATTAAIIGLAIAKQIAEE